MRPSLAVAIPVLVAACGRGAAARPEAIAYGEVACDFCHMMLEQERRAAQFVPAHGAVRVFDEPGCLMHYLAMSVRTGDVSGTVWVHDEATGEWMDARRAVFVVPAQPVPGMMYGVLAYRDRARAEEARGDGSAMDFGALLGELRG